MTTHGINKVTCSVCGKASEQEVLMSTNSFGSPDLDLRPPEMERSTMSSWLHECPHCGFVSNDLSEAEKGIQEILATQRFVSLRRGAGTLIGRCLKRSLLDMGLGNSGNAAEHTLWAAWAADDADDPSAAEYRSKAADLFLVAASSLPSGSTESTTMRARTIDILRRARRFDDAIDLADALLAKDDLDPTIRSVVEFGRSLAQAGEHSRHTVKDAISE
jgi:hypothetical protein